MLKYNSCGAAIITILLLLTSSLVVLAINIIPSAQAQPPSSNGPAKTTKPLILFNIFRIARDSRC